VARKGGLGRSLNELLGDSSKVVVKKPQASAVPATSSSVHKEGLHHIPVEFLQRGMYQPRQDIAQEPLQELADSIKEQGIIQPIIVRPMAKDRYEIIAGERRWRAAQMAGLSEVPVIIKKLNDDTAMAMALIENIQREDLNAMEQARALFRLSSEFKLTHEEIAKTVGKSRTSVTNLLRLNQLHGEVQTLLEHGELEMGHARAILALATHDQAQIAREVVQKKMTVRNTEALVRRILTGATKPSAVKAKDHNISSLETELAEKLGATVMIEHKDTGKGKLVIQYNSLDELDGILEHIK
jgi:ParB family transcriptional regulator, chromosome partitioning protein